MKIGTGRWLIAAVGIVVAGQAADEVKKPGSEQTLFDGKSLSGWEGDAKWWRVEGGAIIGEIPAGGGLVENQFLFWEGELHDFELRLRYRISGNKSANSGVQFRSKKVGHGAAGYQADLDDGATWIGRIYDEHGRALLVERGSRVVIDRVGKREVKTFRQPKEYAGIVKRDDWNEYVIKAIGSRIQTWVNGELAADLTDDQADQQDFSGKLAFQLHSGPGLAKVEFKDIVYTPLGKTEPPKVSLVAKPARSGISPEGRNLGFEDGSLSGWTASGDAWGDLPIKGDTVALRRAGQASMHDGKFWVGGFEHKHSDASQGVLNSGAFKVTHPWGSFLVGGGAGEKTRVDLVDADSGEVVFTASGKQTENMEAVHVDLTKHLGKRIQVRVVDESSGGWGHVNYDDFRFHESKMEPDGRPQRVRSNPILKHLTPNPASDNADSTVADMWVPEGFKVELLVKEPDVTQPIAFTFDERGRLWVAEAHSYPRRQPEGKGKDNVVIFEDVDGDGAFEKKSTFATGLNLVSGLEVGFGGIWVGAAPHLLFIPDKNRDDVPDGNPVVLLDGWGLSDTHETLNSFTWGPDGWLYGNHGVFNHSLVGKPGAPDGGRIEMRAGVWRYHPGRHEFEVFAHGGSNQWGIDFNEAGDLFITHCRSAWGGGPTTYVVRNGHYWNQANSNHASFVSGGTADWNSGNTEVFRNYLPASAAYGHGEGGAGKPGSREIYGGHSHVGTMIYLGGNWPAQYRDQLFTLNLHGHQMNRQTNERSGSGYNTLHSGSDQLYVPDPRFIGVDLKYGPDGAVYMIDWHDKQHCHTNNVDAWDRTDGRIYRMAWTETHKPVKIDLGKKSTAELLALVTSPDEWYSRTARRLLQERHLEKELASAELAPLLETLADADASAAKVLRAMWALHLTGRPSSQLTIKHPDENVRAWAVRLRTETTLPEGKLVQIAENERSPVVRLALASALPDLGDNIRWQLAETLAAESQDRGDRYLPKMIWYGIAPLAYFDPGRAMRLAQATPMPVLADSLVWFLSRDALGREQIASSLAKAKAPEARRMLELMAFSLPSAKRLPAPSGWGELSANLRNAQTAYALDKLGALFGDESVFAAKRKIVADKTAATAERREAFEFLKATADTGCADEFIVLLDEPVFRSLALPLLGRFNDPTVAAALVKGLPGLGDRDRNAALVALSSKPALADALLEAVRDKRVDKGWLTSLHIRQMQNLGDAALNRKIAEVWGRVSESSSNAKASIDKYSKLYSTAPRWSYDANAGAAVFAKVCAACHLMDGKGVALGPDLSGSHSNGVDYFIENIVDPNAVVGENFQLNIVTKKDGTIISGMPANETDEVLTIRTVTEAMEIPKDDIKTHQVLEQSMMPPSLLDSLDEKEVVELLIFLTKKK